MLALVRDEMLGAMATVVIYSLCIVLFLGRISGQSALEWWLGCGLLLTAIPLAYLGLRAPRFDRPALFYAQIGLMILYLVAELVLDYWLRVDFRGVRWAVVSYTTLFFAGTGGMIGVASLAGRGWSVLAIVLFLTMAVLAFAQRAVTGM